MARADATRSDARARRGIAAVAGTGIFGDRRRLATSDLTTNESWKGAPHRGCFGGRRCQLPRFLLTVRTIFLSWLGIAYLVMVSKPQVYCILRRQDITAPWRRGSVLGS